MFGNTSLIMGSDRIVRERLGSSWLADFVRLEFRLEDQPSGMFSLRRAAVKERRRRPAYGVVRRFRSWRATTRGRREAVTAGDGTPASASGRANSVIARTTFPD